jgi:hypothetical protein
MALSTWFTLNIMEKYGIRMFHNIINTDKIHIVFLCYVVPARRIRLKEYRFYVTKLLLMENGSLQAVVRILM